jgi:hypothetical protein
MYRLEALLFIQSGMFRNETFKVTVTLSRNNNEARIYEFLHFKRGMGDGCNDFDNAYFVNEIIYTYS